MRIRDWDRNLRIRLIGESFVGVTFWMIFPFIAIYFSEMFGKEKTGVLLAISQLFSVIANLLGGYFADRFGRKKMMVVAACGQALAFFLFALFNSPLFSSPLMSFICFALVGICGSLYWPASQAMVADVVSEKDQSRVFAVFYTMNNVMVVIGPLLGGIFYPEYRFFLFLIAGTFCAIVATVLFIYLDETAPIWRKTTGTWYMFFVEQLNNYRLIAKDRTFLLFIVAGILVAQTFMQLDILLPVYIKEVVSKQTLFSVGSWSLSLSGEKAFSVLIAENGLLVALFTVAVTKWMENYKEKWVFVFSSLFYGIAIFLFGQTTSLWMMIFLIALFTLAELMTVGLQQTFVAKLAPEHMRGQYFAAASLRFTLGRMMAPLALTLPFAYHWTFFILTLLAICSAWLYAIMFRSMEEKQA
ncbi:MFS transporter [Anoxybacillus flavithermus]|uniref:MFS transporter n=1 Tax=Anoxybacillus flavithermus TaxID=33934 RepID=A0A2G5RQV9_9BACL|nr:MULTISPECIES: MFS transporter [Anoxybacillus]KFZ43407.1 MFS transporter [Anoxybacillus sp. KU2-6(11)]PIC05093.1 MFS transporter [Anoxybacillus flavithermus]